MKAKTTLQALHYFGSRIINEVLISLDITTNNKPKRNSRKNFKKAIAPLLLFVVLGFGKSWGQVTIASQDFETAPALPTLSFSNINGGNSTGTNPAAGLPSSANLFVSGVRGWQSVNTTTTLTFGNQSLSGYTNAFVDFRLAGMSVNNTNGIDAGDIVTVSISVDGGTTYSSELTIAGSAANQRWAFSASGSTSITYDGNNTPTAVTSASATGVSTVTINIPNANSQVRVRIAMLNNDANERWVIDDVRIRGTVSATPTISSTGTLTAVNTTYGTATASPSTFSVSGADMTAGILVTPPSTSFEVSTAIGGPYTNTITVGAAGTIASTAVYIRLKPTATFAGSPYSGDVVLSSSGATSVNVATASSTVTRKGLTITGVSGVNKVYDRLTTATLSGPPAYSGLENSESFSVTGTPSASFADALVGTTKTITITGYTAPSTNYTITQPSATADITQKALTITGISANNKVFDGNTTATLSGTTLLSGVISPDVVTVGGTPIATFASSAIATGISVTVTGYTIGGADAGNYSITQPTGLTADITSAAAPTISTTGSLSAVNTSYGSASASPSTFSVSGANMTAGILVTPPSTNFEVSTAIGGPYTNTITVGAAGTIASTAVYIRLKPTATVAGSPYSGNIVLSSSGASNVNVATVSSSVTAKGLTITGIAGVNKVYDRTTTATLSGTPAYSGLENSESFSVTGTPIANFSDFLVGTGKTITIIGYTAPSTNYSVTQPTGLTANIAQRPLTITGATVTSKTYTGTNPATITGGSLSSVISPDSVSFSGGGTFASVNVGAGISVTPSLTLGGTDAGNYSLTQPTLTGTITTATLTITGLTGADKVYNANNTASFTGTPAYSGLQNSESFAVTGSPTAAFATKTVANAKPITVTGYTAPSTNYTVTQPTLSGNITAFNLTVTGATANNKVYDRLNTATITGSTLVGVFGGDTVTITTSGTFASFNVATGIVVTSTQTLSGADAGNYTVTLPTGLTANIAPKPLTITSPVASNKVFDGNTTATITGTLVAGGVIAPDAVTLVPSGTFASSAIANGIAVTSTSTLTGLQAGNYSLTQPTGLTANITPNALSTITTDGTYGYSQNIAYINFQTTPVPASAANSVGVHNIILTDGPDLDTLPTILQTLNYTYTGTANTIRAAALFTTSNSKVADATSIGANSIAFTGLNVTAPDPGNIQLILRVTFTTTVTDNQKLVFTVSGATVAGSNTSSLLSSFGAVSDNLVNDYNRIEVIATKISVGTQPAQASVNTNMTAFTFRFEDDNNNLDFDTNRTVSLTTTGTNISPATPSVTITAPHTGIATFSTVQFTYGPQTNITLTGNTVALTTNAVTTDPFNVISFLNNDFRTITGTGLLWSTVAHWERFDGTNWVAASAVPGSTRRVWIRGTMGTVPSTTVREMTVENGGILTSSNAMSVSDKLLIESGGRYVMNAFLTMDNDSNGSLFEIEDNGTFEYANTNTSPALFQGDENFHPESNFVINNWNNGLAIVDQNTATRAITPQTYLNPNTGANYVALFGNLLIRDNDSGIDGIVSVVGGLSFNLTHRNLEIESTSVDTDEIVLMRGAQTIGIGGNVIVKNGYFVFCRASSSAQVVTIEGNLVLQGSSNAAAVIGDIANSSTTNVNLKGNLDASGANRLLSVDLTNCFLNFAGPSTILDPQTVDIDPYSSGAGPYNQGVSFTIDSGAYTKIINQDWTLGDESDITVKTLGVLDFGFSPTDVALNITEAGLTTPINSDFFLETRGTLKITSPAGITSAVANTGNVRTNLDGISARAYSNTGIYHYIGKANQVTGDGLPNSNFGKRVIVEMDLNTLTLTPPSVIPITNDDTIGNSYPGGLEIRKGVVLGTTTADFTGTGVLIMSGGLYQINVPAATSIVPRLTGTYTLTGGTVELNGSLAQTLRGGNAPNTPSYFNLKMSGTNTVKINNTPIEVSNILEVSNASAIFDVEDNSMTGNAGITMSGGLLRLSQKNSTLPGLTGIATIYSLTGGTIELYGTSSAQTHSLRGTYGTGSTPPNVNYFNVELNSTGANVAALNANVVAQAGFGIVGTMNVNSPTCFQLASGFTITDAGATSSFNLNVGATLKYGGTITPTASGATGNIRTDTRTFPTNASYGFVGSPSPTQTTGTGLPSSMINMYMDKDASTDFVTLTNPTTVTGALTFYKGKLDIAANTLSVGSAGSITGASAIDYVVTSSTGNLIRNIGGSGTFTYPIGSATAYNPSSFVWSATPGITSYALRYVATTATIGSGLPASAGCVSAGTLVNNGHWVGTSVGTATNSPAITFTRNGHTNAGANLNLHAILRRDSSATAWGVAGTWTDPGSIVISPATAQISLTQTALATANNFSGEFAIGTGTNATATAAVLSAAAATICLGTSPSLSVAITGSGSLYDLSIFDGTSNFSVTNYISGTPFAAPPTSSNKTYSITSVTIGGSCVGSGNSGSPTVNIGGTSTYVSNTWTPSDPTATSTAVIDGGVYNVAANINACSLEVKNNAVVTIPSTYNVTLRGAITVANGSSFTLESGSNLVQTDGTTNANTGSIQVKRNSSSLYLLDYTLWSSPVENQNLYAFSPNTLANRFYVYNTPTNQYIPIASSNNFTAAKGYLIRAPKNYSSTTPAVYNGTFTGKPNSGTITFPMSISGTGFNAVGNPYPSQINVHNFIDTNVNTTGVLYFWRKKNDQTQPSYATLTKIGYTANSAPGGGTANTFNYFNTLNNASNTWVINVGQGFFVQATAATDLVFTNAMRRGVNNSNQFFRTSKATDNSVSLYKLNLTSVNGFFSQMLVGYSSDPNYTLGVDRGIDGLNINLQEYISSSIDGVSYTIQGRPEFAPTDIVPLQYKIAIADDYSISIEQFDGLFADQDVFIKDKLTNGIHNLKTGSYTFGSESGMFSDRFEVVYENPLSTIDPKFNQNSVLVYKQNQEVDINTGTVQVSNVKIYDIRGRLLVSKSNINASQVKMYAGTTKQVLIVKITSDTNGVVTKKLIN